MDDRAVKVMNAYLERVRHRSDLGCREDVYRQGYLAGGEDARGHFELTDFDDYCKLNDLTNLECDQLRAHLVQSRIRKLMEWYFDLRLQDGTAHRADIG